MVQIIDFDIEMLQKCPHVIELLYEIFGPKNIGLFAVVDNNQLCFVGRDGGDCVYIHSNGYNRFTLNDDEELGALHVGDFDMFFSNDDVYFVDGKKMEHYIQLEPNLEPDEDGYDGYVSYKQYNPETDTLCETTYQHMYREMDGRPIIYGYHLKKIDCLYIDEQFNKKSKPGIGLLPKRAKYYSKVEFDSDQVGYNISLINEHGFIEFLSKGAYALQNERFMLRYVKTRFVDLDGNYRDFWPFERVLKKEEISEMIKSYGFRDEVPASLIDAYNGRNDIVNNILEIVEQMKEIHEVTKNGEDSEKIALLRLRS